jgi:tRNA (adenine22-N1)-methyltransferase
VLPETAPALAPRLAAVAALVPEGSRAADVGCDHGLLAVYLAASGRCAACIATEVDEASLARTRRPLDSAPWARLIVWRAGDGLAALEPDDAVDVVILAGLGAATILRLLSTPRLDVIAPGRIVVQPQTDTAAVRAWLAANGWAIVAETVVRDRGRFYEIAAAERGAGEAALAHPVLSRDDVLAAGPMLLRTAGAEFRALWESRHRRLERIASSGARGAMAHRALQRAHQAHRILATLRGQTLNC